MAMTSIVVPNDDGVDYPADDGEPMCDNPWQFDVMVDLVVRLRTHFQPRADEVAVFGNMLWYPRRGDNRYRRGPDAMVAFGRPQTPYPDCWKQWMEGDLGFAFVAEVLSPSNTRREMKEKREWYRVNGVLEYLVFDPDRGGLEGWVRRGDLLVDVADDDEVWTSDLLGITFSSREVGPGQHVLDMRQTADGSVLYGVADGALRAEVAEHAARAMERELEAAQADAAAAQADAAAARSEAERLTVMLRSAGIEP